MCARQSLLILMASTHRCALWWRSHFFISWVVGHFRHRKIEMRAPGFSFLTKRLYGKSMGLTTAASRMTSKLRSLLRCRVDFGIPWVVGHFRYRKILIRASRFSFFIMRINDKREGWTFAANMMASTHRSTFVTASRYLYPLWCRLFSTSQDSDEGLRIQFKRNIKILLKSSRLLNPKV